MLGEAGLRACAQEKLIVWSQPGMRGLWWGPYDQVLEGGARAVAQLRSARDSDRERAWRHGALGLLRVGARAFGRGVPRERERRRAVAARDAQILADTGPDPKLAGLAEHAVEEPSEPA
jgi:hypothetical protein